MGPEEAVDSINGYFEKVAQWFVGDMEPEIKLPGQIWIDSYNKVIKQRNLENTGWIVRAPWSGAWGLPIGTKISQTLLPATTPGFILATGTTLIRADWPIFWAAVQAGNNIVTDAVWSAEKRYGSYSYGDGETTFRIPDLRGDFIRGYDPGRGIDPGRVLGSWQGDAIRNLTGTLAHGTNSLFWDGISTVSGVFAKGGEVGASANTGVTGSSAKSITLDASRMVPTANENRPRNIAYPFLIYTGEVW